MKTNIKLKKAYSNRLNQEILRKKALLKGVNLMAPETIFLSADTFFGKNVTIEPYVVFGTKVKIGNNVTIKSFSNLENCIVENKVDVGPYARIRPGVVLKEGSKVGNFVEIKNSKIGNNTKINHLAYIGDTIIGTNTNIGAGTITCNYDGIKKNKTTIGNNVFIGSNCSLIAPIKIGNKSFIAAGSTISNNVDKNGFSIARAKQQIIKNGRSKFLKV